MIRIVKESIEDDFDDMFDFGSENAEWYDSVDAPKECVKGATLLSKEEYEKYKNNIREADDSWWLQSPGDDYDSAYSVSYDGYTSDYYGVNYAFGVRPSLILNLQASNLGVGDKIDFGGHVFTIISNDLAICDDFIGKECFREDYEAGDANDYEKSDVKKIVDDWFNKAYVEYEG